MDLKEIKAIYKFLKGTDIVEIEVERGGEKISIKRADARGAVPMQAVAPVAQAAVAAAPPASEPVNDKIKTVTAPMVGTFYLAPSPEATAFVEVGSVVKAGQSLCIIEAMKLMNEVDSEYGGKILSILVENGQPVEYGEPLFTIET